MQDFIVTGPERRRIACVDIHDTAGVDHRLAGSVIWADVPPRLLALLADYDALVAGGCLALLDDVERAIDAFELRLSELNVRLYALQWHADGRISGFDAYPSGRGFLPHSPWCHDANVPHDTHDPPAR